MGGALKATLHTDGCGAFYIYTGERSYEFRKGAGCNLDQIVPIMVQKVVAYMDRHHTVVTMKTFFTVLSDAVDEGL